MSGRRGGRWERGRPAASATPSGDHLGAPGQRGLLGLAHPSPARNLVGLALGLATIAVAIAARVGAHWVGALGAIAAAPIGTSLVAGPAATTGVAGAAVAAIVWAGTVERSPPASPAALAILAGLTTISGLVAVGLTLQRKLLAERVARLASAARVVQVAVQPEPPAGIGNYSFSARYFPADSAARLGGDFYAVAETDFGPRLIIGDGRGSGLPVVHLSVAILGSFGELARTERDLRAIALALDHRLGDVAAPSDFVTAIVLQLSPDGQIDYVNCGHPDPVAVAPDGVHLVRPTERCVPLGLGVTPTAQVTGLAPGGRLLLFTDGVSECRDADGRFFDVVAESAALQAATSLDRALGVVAARFRLHRGGRVNDDATLFALEYGADRPPPSTGRPGSRRQAPT